MFLGVIASLLISAQPVCTPNQFREIVNPLGQGEHVVIAQAIFDAYSDAIQQQDTTPPPAHASPLEQLEHKKKVAQYALASFEEFVGSLQLVDESMSWKLKVANMRRGVLLESRHQQNPWSNAVWANLPWGIVEMQKDLVFILNQFLIENFNQDLLDRFDAELAMLQNNLSLCKSIEARSMKRWSAYDGLVKHIKNLEFEQAMFPQINHGEDVRELMNWILKNIQVGTVVNAVTTQFHLWEESHQRQKNATKSVVRSARLRHGVDPWSNGCGAPSQQIQKIKNQLLKSSAEMQEFNNQTVNQFLKLLTDEQIAAFQSHS